MSGNFISRIFLTKKKKENYKKISGAEHSCLRVALNFRNKEKMHWNYEGIVSISQNVMK